MVDQKLQLAEITEGPPALELEIRISSHLPSLSKVILIINKVGKKKRKKEEREKKTYSKQRQQKHHSPTQNKQSKADKIKHAFLIFQSCN